ncbi:unnamed protein product [Penicillium viridicatum]
MYSPPGGHFSGTGIIYSPTAAGSFYSTATPAEPTQSGTISDCGLFYNVVSGDTCSPVALRFYGIIALICGLITLSALRKYPQRLLRRMVPVALQMEIPSVKDSIVVVQSTDIAVQHPTTAAQETVCLALAKQQLPPPMAPVVQPGVIQLARIQALAHAAPSMGTVALAPTIAVQGIVIRENALVPTGG